MEVGLHDGAVFYSRPFLQYTRETVNDAALDIAPRHLRLYDNATIDGNRLEGAVYYGFFAYRGGGHLTITNNDIRADNDTPIIFNNMAFGI